MITTTRSTRLVGLLFALLMTATVQGTMLWKFNDVAHQASLAQVGQTALTQACGNLTRRS